jgi:signal transduction histidine kinase
MLQTSIGQDHQFNFTPQADRCPVWLDEQLLWHLLTNLLSNAIKYSPADHTQSGQINLDLTWTHDRVAIGVRDNGIGIPPDAESRLFEPFYRADNTGEILGTGLGLALAKQCAERQGGTVHVLKVSQGATFIVDLPRDHRSDLEL